jgi:hypothetical protein
MDFRLIGKNGTPNGKKVVCDFIALIVILEQAVAGEFNRVAPVTTLMRSRPPLNRSNVGVSESCEPFFQGAFVAQKKENAGFLVSDTKHLPGITRGDRSGGLGAQGKED